MPLTTPDPSRIAPGDRVIYHGRGLPQSNNDWYDHRYLPPSLAGRVIGVDNNDGLGYSSADGTRYAHILVQFDNPPLQVTNNYSAQHWWFKSQYFDFEPPSPEELAERTRQRRAIECPKVNLP